MTTRQNLPQPAHDLPAAVPAEMAAAADRRAGTSTKRRALFAGGAAAALGAAGVAAAGGAQAAPRTMVIGTNEAGTATTYLHGRTTGAVLYVKEDGPGPAAVFTGAGVYAMQCQVTSPNAWAVRIISGGVKSAGAGGGLLCEGLYNPGLYTRTVPQAVNTPALLAHGSNGQGVAMQTLGQSYLDGEVWELYGAVAVPTAASSTSFDYAPTITGETSYHTQIGNLTLSGTTASVVLSPDTLAAIVLSDLVVTLTPRGVSMPNLSWSLNSNGFAISGGVAGQTVSYQAMAPRRVLSLQAPARAAARDGVSASSEVRHTPAVAAPAGRRSPAASTH